jgi:hypothetical protein
VHRQSHEAHRATKKLIPQKNRGPQAPSPATNVSLFLITNPAQAAHPIEREIALSSQVLLSWCPINRFFTLVPISLSPLVAFASAGDHEMGTDAWGVLRSFLGAIDAWTIVIQRRRARNELAQAEASECEAVSLGKLGDVEPRRGDTNKVMARL